MINLLKKKLTLEITVFNYKASFSFTENHPYLHIMYSFFFQQKKHFVLLNLRWYDYEKSLTLNTRIMNQQRESEEEVCFNSLNTKLSLSCQLQGEDILQMETTILWADQWALSL